MKRTATIFSSSIKSQSGITEKRHKRQETGPSESVIRNILNYSKALEVYQTQDSGIINLVMN